MQLELAGFTTVVRENLRLEVGQSAVLSFTMKLATVQETVTVSGESPLVETQKSELAGRVSAGQVQDLPLNGRNWLDLVALVPGARGNPGTVRAGFAGGDMAKYQVDGVDVSGKCCGGSNQGYSQENIQEFEVITNRYDAEYGRAAGVVINAVTKSGTNQLRGSAFSFIRDSDLGDAPNFFTNTVQPFHEKQSGLNGGGPIKRDRAFFFASYEYQSRAVTAIPKTGFAAFDVPASNDISRHYTTVRVDMQLGQKHRLFARSSKYNWEQINVGVGERNALSNGYSRPSKNTDLSVGDTWVISNRMVHEIRAGFSAIDNKLVSNSTLPLHTFPSIIIGSPTNSPQWWTEFNVQITNSLSYFVPSWHGEHSLKTGFQFFRPDYKGAFPSADPWGASYTFSTDPGNPNDPSTYPAPTRYSVVLGDPSYEILNTTYGVFFKDDWVLSPKLTLNLGFRYDIELGTVNTDLQSPIEPGEKKGDYNNVAPRLGFAYDLARRRPHGHPRRLRPQLRQGAAQHLEQRAAVDSVPVRQLDRAEPVVHQPAQRHDLRAKSRPEPAAQHRRDRQRLQDADADQVSIGVAHQFGARMAVQMDYVHSEGFNEPRARSINFFEDPATHLPNDPESRRTAVPAVHQHHALRDDRRLGLRRLAVRLAGAQHRPAVGDERRCRAATRCRGPTATTRATGSTASTIRSTSRTNGRSRPAISVTGRSSTASSQLPWDFQVAAIFFVGSPRPINTRTNLDPFGSGAGRWLDATGRTIARNSERTQKNDYKLDLRLSKNVHVVGRVRLQGIIEAFNILNTKNLTELQRRVWPTPICSRRARPTSSISRGSCSSPSA